MHAEKVRSLRVDVRHGPVPPSKSEVTMLVQLVTTHAG